MKTGIFGVGFMAGEKRRGLALAPGSGPV